GRRLFQGAAGGRLAPDEARNPAYERPSDAAPGYPPRLERILLRALEPNREARYPSARAMQADLEEFIKAEGIPVSSLATSAWMHATFEEKIVREQEALRGIDDLVTTVGTREELLEQPIEPPTEAEIAGNMGAACAVGGSIAPHAIAPPHPVKWPLGSVLVPLVSVVAAAVAVVNVRHDASLRLAQGMAQARAIGVPAPATGPAPASEPTGSLEIVTRPEGCVLAVEGVVWGNATPAKVDHLPVGRELHVTVTKDGYETLRTTATLSAEAPFKELELELKKRAATLVIQFPPPAPVDIWLDGKRYTGDRTRIEGLAPDHDHVIGFSAPGYEARSYRVALQPGQTKALNVVMPKAQTAPPE
ncbi:MAG: PEGA domain-containing protein, partial [Myxococcales bacterium]|nr:PEGA domain-containing protein [Myxococcales bacterium]